MARKRTNLIGNTVLIETSWNVKEKQNRKQNQLKKVLIETSWNVKLIIYLLFSFTSSINRNIVECKDWSQTLHSVLRRCINRNIVECKVLIYPAHF